MVHKAKRNVIVGQSGGPTAAINSSLAGVYRTAIDRGYKKVYGMIHGVQGLMEGRYVDLSDHIQSGLDIELLKRTPSAYLGSCRFKLPEIFESKEIYEKTQNEISVLDNYGDKAMCDIILNRVPAFLKDKEMCKTGLKEEYLLNIVMLKRGGEALSVEKDTILAKNDEIVVFGDYGLIKELFMGD